MTRRRHRRTAVLAGVVIATLAALVPAVPVAAHGVVDQGTKGATANEPCSAAEYPGAPVLTTGESRQSFVPVDPGLSGVELCIDNLVGVAGTDFTVNIYEKGEAGAADELLASKGYDSGTDLLAAQWVHVDLDTVVATTPGTKYIIGVTPASGVSSPVTLRWRSTCDGLLAPCSLLGAPLQADLYTAGETNNLPGEADYGFRTITPEILDLVADVSVDPGVCPGLDLAGHAVGTARNLSTSAVDGFTARWLWSADNAVSDDDAVLSDVAVPGVAAQSEADVTPPVLPADLGYGPGYLLLQVNADGSVPERDDTNNLAAAPSTVTACAQPDMSSLDLSVAEEEVGAGFQEVQFADLSSAALASLPQSTAETLASPAFQPNSFSPNSYSPNSYSPNSWSPNSWSPNSYSSNGFAPNSFSPNSFSPNSFSPNSYSPNSYSPEGFSPNSFSAAGGVLLSTVLDDLPPSLPKAMHVVDIPIVGDGWETRLTGLINQPIQNVTLAEASQLLPDLMLEEVDLTRIFTSSWMALALANAPLNSIPLDWCDFIADNESTCGGLGVDPATTSLLGLEAAGFPTHLAPIADLTLDEVAPDQRWLVADLPLSGPKSFHLALTRLGQLPADAALVDASAVVDCDAFTCARPLVEAQAAGAIRNVTVRALLEGLSTRGRETATLGDLAMGTSSLGTLRLSAANWNLADIHQTDPACPQASYQLGGTNSGDGAAIDPTVTVALPAGFVYVPGSVALLDDGDEREQTEPSSTIATGGVRTYTFALDAEISSTFQLSFAACANEYLGPVDVGSATLSGKGIQGPYEASTTSPDTLTVVERTPGVTTQAISKPDNVVIADHISTVGDYDSFTFPVKAPRTLTIVKLFSPPGVDLDLLAYGPESSSLTFNPNSFSPNSYSPNSFSPNSYSPNSFSPNSFSPNSWSPNSFSPNSYSPNSYSPNSFSETAQPDTNDDLPIRELQPADSSGHAVSANRGDATETLYLVSGHGDAGDYTIAVADYNGQRSDAPYFLTVQTLAPTANPALESCATTPWDLSQPAGAPPAAWTGSTPPKTLFVTNQQVTASAFGTDEAEAGLDALQDLAARSEVRGIVLNVDADAEVRAAYADWRNKWCDPTAANVVASMIRGRILAMREQHPTIDTIVLAGGDIVIPDFRLDDRSAMASEDHYTAALLRATRVNTPVVSAFANSMIPSADPYGNEGALPFGMTYAFPPSAGVSRLIETPADWVAQRDQYVLADGLLSPTSAFISAYDGMVDGAEAAAAALEGVDVPTTLLTDTTSSWTADEFRAGAFASGTRLSGWNGHAHHFGLLSDDGSERNDESEQVTTAESESIPAGALVFSNGCHFGTAIDDLLNQAPTESERIRLKDWAQAITDRRGIAVANTGFGIFDTIEVAQGERLQQLFVEEMSKRSNVSLALAAAKNRFFAAPGVYDAYTYKTMHQLTMYGLGILKMFGTSADPAPPARPPAADRVALTEGPYPVDTTGTSSCTSCYLVQQSDAGSRIVLRDDELETGHTAAQGYWSAPMSTRTVTLPQGRAPAGVWINGLDSATLHDQDLVNTRLAVDDPATELESQNAAPFPTKIASVNAVGPTAHVNLLHGIAVPQSKKDGKVHGDIHLYTKIDADLLLRPEAAAPCGTPTITSVTSTRLSGSDRVAIDVYAKDGACAPNSRAAVLGRASDGSWVYGEAVKTAGGHWLTSILLPPDTELEDLLAQVWNGHGVGYWRFKGDRPIIKIGYSDGVDVALSGTQHATGIYKSDVTATIIGTPGVTYDVYDKGVFVGRFGDGETFTISGDGQHEIIVLGTDGSSAGKLVLIDTAAAVPVITWVTPATNGATYRWGDDVRLDVRCADASGSTCAITLNGTPISNGAALATRPSGTYTLRVTATDAVGNSTTSTRTFTVQPRYTISQFHSPIKPKPNLNVVSSSSNLTIKFTVTDHGVEQTDPSIIARMYWQAINCSSKAPTSSSTFTTAGSTPEYSGFFHFNLAAPASNGCYALYVELIDGTTQSAYFQVKK